MAKISSYPIVGFDKYVLYAPNRLLDLRMGRERKTVRGHYNMTDNEGNKHHFPEDRIVYCAYNGIDPRTLRDMSIVDGVPIPRQHKAKISRMWQKDFVTDIEIAHKCCELQKVFVKTGDIKPILDYIMTFADEVRDWAERHNRAYNCTYRVSAEDLLYEAITIIGENISTFRSACLHPRMLLMSTIKNIARKERIRCGKESIQTEFLDTRKWKLKHDSM